MAALASSPPAESAPPVPSVSTFDAVCNPEFDVSDWHHLVINAAEQIVMTLGSQQFDWYWFADRELASRGFHDVIQLATTDAPRAQVLFQAETVESWFDLAAGDALGLGVIIGVALATTWPKGPAGFGQWLDDAVAYAGLDHTSRPRGITPDRDEILARPTVSSALIDLLAGTTADERSALLGRMGEASGSQRVTTSAVDSAEGSVYGR